MQARQPQSSAEQLPMKERNHDFLAALAAGPPAGASSSANTPPARRRSSDAAYSASGEGAGGGVYDEDLHAADGLEEFQPDDEAGWPGDDGRAGAAFDSRPPAPTSSYARSGAPAELGQFGTPQLNEIGRDPPRAVVRVERDWVAGDVAQFHTSFPLELEGRISPTKFQDLINDVNAILLSANSVRHAVVDNVVMVATMHLSLLFASSHFQKELTKLEALLAHANDEVWHPAGLSVRSPRPVAFQFLEIEYY